MDGITGTEEISNIFGNSYKILYNSFSFGKLTLGIKEENGLFTYHLCFTNHICFIYSYHPSPTPQSHSLGCWYREKTACEVYTPSIL